MKKIKKIIKFSFVGFICFLIDLFFAFFLIKIFGMPEAFARYPSWLIAVSSSYLLNLNFTFRSDNQKSIRKIKKFERYILFIFSQAFGGLINIMAYTLSILKFNLSIFLSILIGTFLGLFFNYFGAKYIIKRNYS